MQSSWTTLPPLMALIAYLLMKSDTYLMPPRAELADASPARETLVLCQKEVTSEETRVDAVVNRALKRHGGRLESHWGPTLYHLEDLPLREDLSDLPTMFTPFKQKVSAAPVK